MTRNLLVASLSTTLTQPGGCQCQSTPFSTDRIQKQIELKALVSRVWRAITDHLEFGEWFRLEPTAEGTGLKITESGFDMLPAQRHETAFRGNGNGWAGQIKNMERYVSDHP